MRTYWAWAERKYLFYLQELEPGSSILELGCGPGYLMELLKRKGFRNVQGIDISKEQIELAIKRGLNARVADVFEFLSSKREVFDAVVGIDFLEHFTKEELLKLLPIIYSSLKNGGRAIFEVPNGQGLFSGQVVYGDMTHLTIFTPGSLMQLLNLYGFKDVKFEETGPAPTNIKGYIRVICWKCICLIATLIKKIETGKTQHIWTENMICFCRK
jgi:cyclopropane fatty-acyl-phospholipid synthase-like methyltransferase